MILVTGATGTIGSRLVSELVAGGVPVRAMTREPVRMAATAEVGVVRGDYDDPASLRAALAGIDALFLLTAPSAPGPGERYGEQTIGAAHDTADQAVRASGMRWTLLRPTTFASTRWGGPMRSRRGRRSPTCSAPAGRGWSTHPTSPRSPPRCSLHHGRP